MSSGRAVLAAPETLDSELSNADHLAGRRPSPELEMT
jgi:hypothetical protein